MMLRSAVALTGTLLAATLVVAPAAAAGPPARAGLTGPVAVPAAPTGVARDVTDFGATPDDPSDDDSGAIQAAIDASSPGDEVLVPDGTFHLTTRNIKLRTGVSVRGASRSGTVLHATFSAQADGKGAYVFSAAPGTSDLTLSRFHVTSNGSTDAATALNYAIWLGDGDAACQECNASIPAVHTIRVTDVEASRFVKMALTIRNGHDITMDHNRVHAALAAGGGGQGYGIMLGYDQTANNWIHHNTIESGAGLMRHGILLQYRTHNNLIEHNTVRDLTEDGIDLHGEDEYANEIRHNVVHGSQRAGIGIGNTGGSTMHGASGPDNWIHHNEVHDSQKGLSLILGSDSTVIEFNDFHDNEQFGIEVGDGGGDGLVIRCNAATDNDVGISIADADRALVECNNAAGNESASLVLDPTATSYVVRDNDLRGAAVIRNSTDGSYAHNCDDTGDVTDCLAPCPGIHRP